MLDFGRRITAERSGSERDIVSAASENDISGESARGELGHDGLARAQPFAGKPHLIRIYYPAISQHPLNDAKGAREGRVRFDQHCAHRPPLEQAAHTADDLRLMAIDVDLNV